ncbi:MAG: response regulator transcription factor [Verrucomicrobiae bacterium]|nr:response regulator transcription factor [Verrucomicrobiae bacterium]
MPQIRILIVDDHEVVRAGIAAMFDSDPRFEIVGQASNAYEAVPLQRSLKPHVTLIDIRMPGGDGLQALEFIRAADPGARVVFLATDAFESDVHFARAGGACGFLTKNITRSQLLAEVLAAFETGRCSPFSSAGGAMAPTPRTSPLTTRELEVLNGMRRGLSNADIAKALGISDQTVKTHVASILHSLGAASRAEAVAIGFDIGLLRTDKSDSSADLAKRIESK